MRYLPPFKSENKIRQLGFPDHDSIALVENAWVSDTSSKSQQIRELLLSNPMLLLWVVQHYLANSKSETFSVPKSDLDVEAAFEEIVDRNRTQLIRDNTNSLTSIERLDLEFFVDVASFFQLRSEQAECFLEKVIHRLAVLDDLIDDPLFCLAEFLQIQIGRKFAVELTVKQFRSSDFSDQPVRSELLVKWSNEIPFFRNGMEQVETRWKRLAELETDFQFAVEKSKLEAMRQLAYGASHEVNNPLANISTRAQALLREEEDPKRRERLKIIDAQAFRAHDMISNLMTFARPPKPVFSRIQLRPILEKVVEELAPIAEIQHTQMTNEVDNTVYLEADPTQVRRMVKELLQNSLEALRRDGHIRIQCDWDCGKPPLRLTVADDGPGISPEVRRHIFDPFFSGREAGRGLGFGMSVVWRMMELHQGTVRIPSVEKGASIELYFPVEQAQENVIERTA